MRFKINSIDISFIVDALTDSELADKFKGAEKYQTGSHIVDLRADEIDTVLDALSDRLMDSGLGEGGEPNSLGYKLESLIDQFSMD
ncbi:hypothetical protein [Vibrio splendidus]|uniref:hypothetical protein n=1 Tax=Vibrio splendidus TaxID=29497 RepID=UPI0002FF9ACB|nr:hypothetical protein [Vibrio splendidus]OEE54089.1 hypothetical protein A146_13390 [Vibrio splendidus FF-500]